MRKALPSLVHTVALSLRIAAFSSQLLRPMENDLPIKKTSLALTREYSLCWWYRGILKGHFVLVIIDPFQSIFRLHVTAGFTLS